MASRRTIGFVAGGSAVAVVAAAGIAWAATGAGRDESPGAGPPVADDPGVAPAPLGDATALADDFLDNWIDDGRVVRRDQGDDTVSEGQAYGLLIALGAGREDDFDQIWSWTQENLVRDDGLLAWQWDDGGVVDDEPASDADLDAARALVLAGDRFGRDDLTADGVTLAGDILDTMTVTTSFGRILLPGLWAVEEQPYAYNPSYASPVAYDVLAEATGDARWTELSEGSAAITSHILDETALPSDWVQVNADGSVDPMPGARGGGDAVVFGFDAARMPLRYAESCTDSEVALAARTLPALDRTDDIAAVLDLGGTALTEDRHPLTVLARAAAASAAGDARAAEADLRAASELSAEFPTYYGRAWVAIGSLMLTGDTLASCGTLEGPSA
ncbi:MAG: glycosyl hydrolase family 8 [Microbacteriaceae bacterium]